MLRKLPIVVFVLLCSPRLSAQDPIQFNRDVRPILSDKCYSCHGPDAEQRQSDWRLDRPLPPDNEIVVPGDPDESELIYRILSDDELDVMPPSDHLKKLTDSEKQTLVRWVEQGAKWQDHWAYESPVANRLEGDENLVDLHLQKRLDELGIAPSKQADRRTLLRRVCFDLIGLPPTPEQVHQFLQDDQETAFDRVVDQLLESPHFGERMAIHWLDQVRYADSVGYHGDQEISVSPFRDYVISAFNKNLPFDQFTREQLAGDLLPNPTLDQRVASGYNRLGMMSAEGGVQPKEYLAKYAAERVRTTSTVWLGMTLGCAECHDHKFDPFSINDFYSFASFFADIKEKGLYEGASSSGQWGPTVSIADRELPDLLKPLDAELAELNSKLHAVTPELTVAQQEWESRIQVPPVSWTSLKPLKFNSFRKATGEIAKDHSILVTGDPSTADTYAVTLELPKGMTARGLRVEALTHPSLPRQGPGRAGNGNFVITELLLAKGDLSEELESLKESYDRWPKEWADQRVELTDASADFEQASSPEGNPYGKWAAESAIDRDVKGATWGWAVNLQTGKPHQIVTRLADPIHSDSDPVLTLTIQQNHGTRHTLGRFRVSVTDHDAATVDESKRLPADLLAVIRTQKHKQTDVERKRVFNYFRSVAPELQSIRLQIKNKTAQREALIKAHTRTSPVTVSVEPREMRVLARGDWMDDTGVVTQPRVPSAFAQIERQGRATRLDLANWILDPENPLTARVFVNRVWKLYFGAGLSKTLDDLGSQGELPSHPELLDALAVEFINSGWDVKHLIRLIVKSQAYQRSSAPRDDLAEIDPYNRLLARQSRFRLDAELVRDNALAVSGLLVRQVGGRSVKPYQPEGLYRHLNFPKRKYQVDQGDNQYRRGLYTHWQRQFLHPAMKAFDAPSREECTCERPRSNTPLGALVMLNDPTFVEAARHFATRALHRKAGSDKARIQWMVENALTRPAKDREVEVLRKLLKSHRDQFRTDPVSARQLLEIGQSQFDETLDQSELAAWTSVARTVMNLHEFIVRN